jgi:hypothetical protein
MTNIKDINIKDVNYFLNRSGISKTTTSDPYLLLWNFIISNNNKNVLVPESIADWVLAYNISNQKINTYNSIEILSSNDDNLEELSKMFGLELVNKTRIIRILNYLNKLTIPIDNLPNEIIVRILLMTNDFRKFCSLSSKFNSICNNEFIPYLREKLEQNTGLKLDKYSKEQLFYLEQQQKYRYKTRLASGNSFVLLISEGKVYSCGSNMAGALGLGDDIESTDIPTEIPDLDNIVEVAVGYNHSLALTKDGKVYGFGDNDGQLGIINLEYSRSPVLISNLKDVISVVATKNTSFVLTKEGNVYLFGEKIGGEEKGIILQDKLKNIIQIAADNDILLALDINGNVHKYDYIRGIINQINYRKKINYIAIGSSAWFALDINNNIYSNGFVYGDIPSNEFKDLDIKRIFISPSYYEDTRDNFYILNEVGNCYRINVNKNNGELIKDIMVDLPSNIVDIGISLISDYFVDIDGNLFVRGQNDHKQLGMGDRIYRRSAVLNPNIQILF